MAKAEVVAPGVEWLKVWAVVGPLLTAAASAVWTRYVQRKDREDAVALDREKRDWDAVERSRQHSRDAALAQKAELRAAATRFFACCSTYSNRAGLWLLDAVPVTDAVVFESSEALTNAFSAVMMLADVDLQKKAIALSNATLRMSSVVQENATEEQEQIRDNFQRARLQFVASVRRALGDDL